MKVDWNKRFFDLATYIGGWSKDTTKVGAVIADLSPVTLDAWYLDLDNVFDTYTIGAKSDFKFDGGKIGVDARYVSLTLDDKIADKENIILLFKAIESDITKDELREFISTRKSK